MELFKSLALVPRGIRYKLLIAFCLMSLIPLLITVYLANSYIFPHIQSMGQVSWVLLITIAVALLGLKLAKEIVDPIARIAIQARGIAKGQTTEVTVEPREDEIGDLGRSLNEMTRRIRENMEELKDYGEKTKEINLEVNKKVMTLSSLLQVGNMISNGKKLQEVLQFVVEKISQIQEGTKTFLILLDETTKKLAVRACYDIRSDEFVQTRFDLGIGIVGNCVVDRRGFKVDAKQPAHHEEIEELMRHWEVSNGVVIPIVLRSMGIGLLGVGNIQKNFSFSEGDEEIYRIFARQVSIAVENDRLSKKTEELEIKDELTDLFNRNFIEQRLDEEIKRVSYSQRPCAFVIFDVDEFKELVLKQGALTAEGVLKKIARVLSEEIKEIDKAARYGDDAFVLLLPEKNKKEAMEIAERIRKKIETMQLLGGNGKKGVTLSGGVSENPIDGATWQELIKKGQEMLQYAKEHGRNQVVGMIPTGVKR